MDLIRSEHRDMELDRPRFLYKYCSAARAVQILRDRFVYLAPVDKLNDVFEASVGSLLTLTTSAANKLVLKRLITVGGCSHEEAEQCITFMSEADKRAAFEVFVQRVQERNNLLRKHSGGL